MENKENMAQGEIPSVEVRIDKMLEGGRKTKAFASAVVAGVYAIHGIRVIESDKGMFVSMPQDSYTKNGATKYRDAFHAITVYARTALNDAVLTAYEQKISEQMEQENDAPETGMSIKM